MMLIRHLFRSGSLRKKKRGKEIKRILIKSEKQFIKIGI